MEDVTAQDNLTALAIGMTVLQHMKQDAAFRAAFDAANTVALQALQEIRDILDDDDLDDPECYQKIQGILDVMERYWNGSLRHENYDG